MPPKRQTRSGGPPHSAISKPRRLAGGDAHGVDAHVVDATELMSTEGMTTELMPAKLMSTEAMPTELMPTESATQHWRYNHAERGSQCTPSPTYDYQPNAT